ncbi:MAG: nucleotidyltransferase domain-containing protein [Chloroflexota bacterium]
MTTLSTSSVNVPPITQRKRIPQEAIDHVVRQIIEKFQPLKIILFGSYAYGTARPESDVDLLVIMETPLKEVEQEIYICQKIEYHFGLDLLVKTPTTLANRLKLGDPFLKEATRKGKVLYERTAS